MIPWEREDPDFGVLPHESQEQQPMTTQKRQVGAVTGASAVGGSLGAAIGQLIIHFVPSLEPVETAVTVIVTAILAVVGGYLVPPKDRESLGIGGIEEPPAYVHPDGSIDDDPGPETLNIPEHESVVTRPPSDLGVDEDDIETSGAHAAEVD